MDALAAYRAFLGLRTHTVGLELMCPVWRGSGGGGPGRKEEPRTSLTGAQGAGL